MSLASIATRSMIRFWRSMSRTTHSSIVFHHRWSLLWCRLGGRCVGPRKSHGGFIVYYGGNIVSWQSKKQAIVACPSTEAEYKSLIDTMAEAMWVNKVLCELGAQVSNNATIWCDSTSAISLSANLVLHSKTKHVVVSFHFVREIADGSITVRHVSTKEQHADILTKAVPWETFRYLRSKLMKKISINLRGVVEEVQTSS